MTYIITYTDRNNNKREININAKDQDEALMKYKALKENNKLDK